MCKWLVHQRQAQKVCLAFNKGGMLSLLEVSLHVKNIKGAQLDNYCPIYTLHILLYEFFLHMHADRHGAVERGKDKALTSHLRTSGLPHTEILGARTLKSSQRVFPEREDAPKCKCTPLALWLWLLLHKWGLLRHLPSQKGLQLYKVTRWNTVPMSE